MRKPSISPILAEYTAKSLMTKKVRAYCYAKKIDLPRCDRLNCTMCLAYHVKGMCNSNCGSAADHVDHTAEEDKLLAEWLKLNYQTE